LPITNKYYYLIMSLLITFAFYFQSKTSSRRTKDIVSAGSATERREWAALKDKYIAMTILYTHNALYNEEKPNICSYNVTDRSDFRSVSPCLFASYAHSMWPTVSVA